MPSSVRSFLPVAGDPPALCAVFDRDPELWLTDARRDGATNRWIVALHAGALRRMVRLSVGDPWRSGTTRWRSLSWDPISADGEAAALDRFLPSLDGELGLHVGDERVTLVLDGRYQPPGGRIGSAVDAVALHRVAQATAGSFLGAVGARMSAQALLDHDPPGDWLA